MQSSTPACAVLCKELPPVGSEPTLITPAADIISVMYGNIEAAAEQSATGPAHEDSGEASQTEPESGTEPETEAAP